MNTSVTPVSKLLDLTGKAVIVTGASGGIGAAIAQRLGEAGAKIAVHYHQHTEPAMATASAIVDSGSIACAIGADLRTETGCRSLLEQTVRQIGDPDILVNNAGIQPVSALMELSATELEDVLRSNITAPISMSRLFAEHQLKRNSKTADNLSITNIASIEGLQPAAGHSHYASSKAALIMFTKAAAQEFGPHGIRVNAVSPGLINRPGLEENWPEGVERYQAASALGRIGENMDIADAVLFLSSAAARWVSGSNLVVDGGVSGAPTW